MEHIIQTLQPIINYIKTRPAQNEWANIPLVIDKLIKDHNIIANLDISHIPCDIHTYTRTSICYDEIAPFEIVLTRWGTNDFSPIHGHPAFLLYYPLMGVYDMDFYDLDADNKPQFNRRETLGTAQYVYHIGTTGRFDNCLHQVFAREPSITLHIYSQLGSLGSKY